MKKTILAIMAACALVSTAHAQSAIVVQRPSLLSDLADTVGALVALPIVLPIAVAEGVVSGTAEAADAILHGTKEVYVVPPQQVVTPAPVVVTPAPQQVVVAQPQVTTITTTTRAPGAVIMTTGIPAVPPPVVEYRVAPPHPAGRAYIVRRR